MKKINVVLNICLIFAILFFCSYFLFWFIEPVMYNSESTGKYIENYEDMVYIESALKKYIGFYYGKDVESLKNCTAFNKVHNDNNYSDKFNIFENKIINELYITSVQKNFNDVYIINFNIDFDEDYLNNNSYKVILKINKLKKSFKVYYDSIASKGG